MAKEYTPYTGRVVTREQAKAEGLAHFFNDEPCIRDHLSQRYVSTGACLACQVVYLKDSRTKERERKKLDPAYKKERLEAQRVRQQRYDVLHEVQERERKNARTRRSIRRLCVRRGQHHIEMWSMLSARNATRD